MLLMMYFVNGRPHAQILIWVGPDTLIRISPMKYHLGILFYHMGVLVDILLCQCDSEYSYVNISLDTM